MILSSDGFTTTLWDVATGREIRSFFSPIDFPVIFLPDSNIIVSNDLELWDITTGNKISTFEGNEENVDFMLLSPDKKTILTGNSPVLTDFFNKKTFLKLWDVTSGKKVDSFEATVGKVEAAIFSKDSSKILLCIVNYKPIFYGIKSLDTTTGHQIQLNKIMNEGLPDVATFSPDARLLLIGDSDGLILRDTKTLQKIHTFQRKTLSKKSEIFSPTKRIVAVAFSPDNKIALSLNEKNNIKFWDVATGHETRSFQVFLLEENEFDKKGNRLNFWYDPFTPEVNFSPDGRAILFTKYVISEGGILHLLDVETGQKIKSFHRHSAPIKAIRFSSDGKMLWTSDTENTLKVWNIKDGNQTNVFPGHATNNVLSADISNDGSTILSYSLDHPMKYITKLWNVNTRHEIFSFHPKGVSIDNSVMFSPDNKTALWTSDKTFQVWNVETGKKIFSFLSQASYAVLPIKKVIYSPDSKTILSAHRQYDKILRLWDVKIGDEIRYFRGNSSDEVGDVLFSLDGNIILTSIVNFKRLYKFGSSELINEVIQEIIHHDEIKLWDVETGQEMRSLKFQFDEWEEFDEWKERVPHYKLKGIKLWDTKKGEKLYSFNENDFLNNKKKLVALEKQVLNSFLGELTFFPDYGLSCHFSFLQLGKHRKIFSFLEGDTEMMNCHDFTFSPEKSISVSMRKDKDVQIWDAQTGQEIAQLVSFLDNKWAIVAPDGRYDTNSPGDLPGISWIMPDDPLTPLPVEIFMKEYFEPRLLPRLLKGEPLPDIPPVSEINRVQPKVTITQITPNPHNSALVSVTVELAGNQKDFQRHGKIITQTTGVHDLRLFRDGQLVAYAPKIPGEIKLDPVTNHTKLTLKNIRLPRKKDIKQVEFSAYAFNDDGVKSSTARSIYPLPKNLKPKKGKVYLITIGVNAYEDPIWDLNFATNDARTIQFVLSQKIAESQANNYTEIVSISLISEYQYQQGQRVLITNQATKQTIQALFNKLAGQSVDPTLLADIRNADKLQTAQPEDMLLLSFSSHGHADNKGNFYLFPYDIGTDTNKEITETLLSHTISSEELSLWLRDVDAGDMVMIIDACHSAASVEGSGFKPGPMDSRGLGQLAYDKGMRILTATQSDDIALEHDDLEHGFLTYSLIKEGIQAGKADWKPKDSQIMLGEWLQHGEKRVPELYAQVRKGDLKTYNRGKVIRFEEKEEEKEQDTSSRLGQQPSLFDFMKRKEDKVIARVR